MRALHSVLFLAAASLIQPLQAAQAGDNGIPVDQSKYANRPTLLDFTGADCPDTPRGLEQVKGNLYRHTNGPGLAVHVASSLWGYRRRALTLQR